jgi:hypothetical protein
MVPPLFEAESVLEGLERPADRSAPVFPWLPKLAVKINDSLKREVAGEGLSTCIGCGTRSRPATWRLGGSLEGLQRILGHSTIKLTECYGRLRPHVVAAEAGPDQPVRGGPQPGRFWHHNWHRNGAGAITSAQLVVEVVALPDSGRTRSSRGSAAPCIASGPRATRLREQASPEHGRRLQRALSPRGGLRPAIGRDEGPPERFEPQLRASRSGTWRPRTTSNQRW